MSEVESDLLLKSYDASRQARGRGMALKSIRANRDDRMSDDEVQTLCAATLAHIKEIKASVDSESNGADRVCSYTQRTHDRLIRLIVTLFMRDASARARAEADAEDLADRIFALEERVSAFSGMVYRGAHHEGASYARGDTVTCAGSIWHCNEPTSDKPGEGSKAWTLAVKRGRDGKDLRA